MEKLYWSWSRYPFLSPYLERLSTKLFNTFNRFKDSCIAMKSFQILSLIFVFVPFALTATPTSTALPLPSSDLDTIGEGCVDPRNHVICNTKQQNDFGTCGKRCNVTNANADCLIGCGISRDTAVFGCVVASCWNHVCEKHRFGRCQYWSMMQVYSCEYQWWLSTPSLWTIWYAINQTYHSSHCRPVGGRCRKLYDVPWSTNDDSQNLRQVFECDHHGSVDSWERRKWCSDWRSCCYYWLEFGLGRKVFCYKLECKSSSGCDSCWFDGDVADMMIVYEGGRNCEVERNEKQGAIVIVRAFLK